MISGLGGWLRLVVLLNVLCGHIRAAVPPEVLDLAMQPPVVNTAPGPEYSDAQRDYAMTIGIERTPKGRLWAAWVAGGDSDKGYFVAASSDDEGRTWSPPRFVIDPPDVPNGLRRRILVGNFWCDPTGKLWLFFDQSMGYFDGRAGAWAITCENPDAANPVWSAPRRLWHGATLNKPTVLANGDWLMPIALWTRDRIGPKELREGFRELDELRMAHWFVSTDQGATWTRRGGVVVPQSDFDEHMTVELKDGRLWMLARTKYGIAETFSSDGGRTWTEPKPSAIQNPSARFFLRRMASGRILLVKNGPLDQRTGRTQMSAFLSEDEGNSWQGGFVFEERNGVSYPDGFQAPDGRIFISYDRERAKEREILMAVFTEADVLAGKAVSPEARLKVLISKALGPTKEATKAPPAAKLLPPDWNAKDAADTVLAGLFKVSAPEVKGAHDAELVMAGDRAYVVYEANDVQPGEAANWPFVYVALAVVNAKTRVVERHLPIARSGQVFANETLPTGACFVPRVLQLDASTLRCYFASESPGQRQSVTWFIDFDLERLAFVNQIHRAKLTTAAGTGDMTPQRFHADAAALGFQRPPKDFGLYIFDSFKVFNGKTYVALNNYPGGQNALAVLNAARDTFEVLGHYNEPAAFKLTESGVNRLPDGTWLAICRQEGGNANYTFATSADGRYWSTNAFRALVPNGASSKPTFDRFNGIYYLGWQEATKVAGVARSVFNLEVSRDGVNWERKYRFETEKSFQYPAFHQHDGAIYLTVTQGDSDPSRKERIMFGRLE